MHCHSSILGLEEVPPIAPVAISANAGCMDPGFTVGTKNPCQAREFKIMARLLLGHRETRDYLSSNFSDSARLSALTVPIFWSLTSESKKLLA